MVEVHKPLSATSALGPTASSEASSGGAGRALGGSPLAELALSLAILLLAWLARLVALSPGELGLDGYLSVGLASLPFRQMLDFSVRDVHPPLFYAALDPWLSLLGPTVAAARWPSVACGVLTVAVTYRLGRDLGGPLAGLLAAALLAASPAHVLTSATVRDFAPGLLLSLLAMLLFLRLVRSACGSAVGSKRLLIAFVVFSALALYTWYFAAVFLLAEAITVALLRPKGARALLVGTGAVGAGFVPWAALALPELVRKAVDGVTVGGGARVVVPPADFLASLGRSLVGLPPGDVPGWGLGAALVWLLLAVAGLGLVLRSSRGRAPFVLAAVGLPTGVLATYALSCGWVGPGNLSRYLLMLLPFGLVGQVGLVVAARDTRRWLPTTLLLLLLPPAVLSYLDLRSIPPYPWLADPALAYVREHGKAGDALLVSDVADLGRYRIVANRPLPTYLLHFAGSPFLWDDLSGRAPAVATSLAANYRRVWFSSGLSVQEPARLVNGELSSRFYLTETLRPAEGTVLKLYQSGPHPLLSPTIYPLGGQMALSGAGVTLDPSGSTVFLGLEWQGLRRPDADYSVFVHLVGPGERTVAQQDGWPNSGLRPTSQIRPGEKVPDYYALRLAGPVEAGNYEIRVGLYRDSTRLMLPDGGSYVVVGRLVGQDGRLVRPGAAP